MDQLNLSSIIAIIIGLIITSIGIIAIIDGLESKSWKKVKGTILSVGIYTEISINRGINFKSSIQYKYRYDNQEYTSDKITAGLKFFSSFRFIAKKELEEYQSGMNVDVYVNPNDKYESVLKPGVQILDIVCLIVGVCVLFYHLIYLFH